MATPSIAGKGFGRVLARFFDEAVKKRKAAEGKRKPPISASSALSPTLKRTIKELEERKGKPKRKRETVLTEDETLGRESRKALKTILGR